MDRYIIVTSESLLYLAGHINKHLDLGYNLYGDVFLNEYSFCQAMLLEKENVSEE